ADGTVKARPVMVEVERIESTTPACLPSIQRLPAASVQYIVPCKVGASIASAARNDRCSVCAMKVAAALLTRTSMGPSRQIASIMASTAAPSRMSQRCTPTSPPILLRMSAAVTSSNSSLRPQMTSSAPSSRKRRPITAPSPEPPPVTRMRFPFSKPVSNIVSLLFLPSSLRANGSRERAPDDRLREAIHATASGEVDCFVATAPRNDGGGHARRQIHSNPIVPGHQIRHGVLSPPCSNVGPKNQVRSMKAILCSQYCQPDDLVLADLPDPVAGPGEA